MFMRQYHQFGKQLVNILQKKDENEGNQGYLYKNKTSNLLRFIPLYKLLILRGTERIRTAVRGFADHRLATRPRYHFSSGLQK